MKKEKKEYTNLRKVIQDPEQHSQLMLMFEQIGACHTEMEDLKNEIKEGFVAITDKLNVDPKLVKNVFKIHYSGAYKQKLDEMSELEFILDKLYYGDSQNETDED